MATQFDNLQVLDAIVVAVSVLVVNVLSGEKRASQVALHDNAMLTTTFPVDLHLSIWRGATVAALGKAKAFVRQMHFGETGARAVLHGWDAMCWHPKRDAAMRADHVGAVDAQTSFRKVTAANRAELLLRARGHKDRVAPLAGMLMNWPVWHYANFIRGDGPSARLSAGLDD